jgi:hypothetical protein
MELFSQTLFYPARDWRLSATANTAAAAAAAAPAAATAATDTYASAPLLAVVVVWKVFRYHRRRERVCT